MKCVEDVQSYLEKEHNRLHELVTKEDPIMAGGPETSVVGDRSEMATHAFEVHKRNILLQHTKDQMAEVERALEKIAKGTYGLCDCCGEVIPAARLEILPQTSFCMGCKSKRR